MPVVTHGESALTLLAWVAGRGRPEKGGSHVRNHDRIWVIVVVVVAALAVWLTTIARAARHPQQEHPQREARHGLVQGGQHVGGGRSVAPRRDAPVPDGGGNPPTPEEEDQVSHVRLPDRDARSPLDLQSKSGAIGPKSPLVRGR